MKFVQLYKYDKLHSKVATKKPTKHIVNFGYISKVYNICNKLHFKLEQKKQQNISETSDIYRKFTTYFAGFFFQL